MRFRRTWRSRGAQADVPKALTLFSQADDGPARRHEGTGLGFLIVKALIELHGGAPSLTSENGTSTTVRLDFPPALPQSLPLRRELGEQDRDRGCGVEHAAAGRPCRRVGAQSNNYILVGQYHKHCLGTNSNAAMMDGAP